MLSIISPSPPLGSSSIIMNTCRTSHTPIYTIHFLLFLILTTASSTLCVNSPAPSFGFSLHHRFSDPVKSLFSHHDDQTFPEYGSFEYVATMAARDRIHHSRRLAGSSGGDDDDKQQQPLTFIAGNTTYRLDSLGFLYYANISVGTPAMHFLVALDTGSDQLWLPCDCISCVHSIELRDGSHFVFNIYNLNTSSTGQKLPCDNPMCEHETTCRLNGDDKCPYHIRYLSANTSSTGYLVEDVLHLTEDSNPSTTTKSKITFGCGQKQTGVLLEGGAPNGLIGLGLEKIAVPSMLANQNLTTDSFSMCFSLDGIGRISFGDKGSSNQSETPFSVHDSHPTYNISINQITVGSKEDEVDIWAIYDTGSSFTILTEPTYSLITKNFDSQVKEQRVETGPDFPFEFCYAKSSCKSDASGPSISMKFKGGAVYNLIHPSLVLRDQQGCYFCLGIIKNDIINIFGQNFMTGYRVIFNREKMVLGWEESDCNYAIDSSSAVPLSPNSPPTTSSETPPPSPTYKLWFDINPKSSGASPIAAHLDARFVIWTLAVTLLFFIQLS